MAYVGSWIKAQKDDPLEIFRAAADAEKVHNYVLAFEQVQEQQQTDDQRSPHEMTLAEFVLQATVEQLENHGRKWNVTLGDRYAVFSDAENLDAAIADVHHAAVNNALYLNTTAATNLGIKPSIPPAAVLAEYPDLVQKYGITTHTQETNMSANQSNQSAYRADAEGDSVRRNFSR